MKKWKIIAPILVVGILAFAFWYGGDVPGQQGWSVESQAVTPTPESTPEPSVEPTPEPEAEPAPEPTPEPTPEPPTEEASIDPEPEEDESLSDPIPEENPVPTEPETATISNTLLTCTLSVRCDTILSNMDWLTEGKADLVPEDGVIFPETQVSFYEGESVFNVLVRELKQQKIHLEFTNTPLYNSAYIEGIHNLYEFDVGEGSGWMYSVNDWFPNYGCSRYSLADGDVIEWVYTCDLGDDVGASLEGKEQMLEQS